MEAQLRTAVTRIDIPWLEQTMSLMQPCMPTQIPLILDTTDVLHP
jgi:hypothetical protein